MSKEQPATPQTNYRQYLVELEDGSRVPVLARSAEEAVSKAKKAIKEQ